MNNVTKLCFLVLYWTSGVTVTETRYTLLIPEPGENELPSSKNDHFILQNINNFEYTIDPQKRFYQRFVVNETHFNRRNGIVILIIAEQKEIQIGDLKKEVWQHYARQLNALLIYVEQRFWGQSNPWMSSTDEHLRYMNSEQTLADFAWLIEVVKSQYTGIPSTTKWIAFGSDRAGTFAAWMRLKYPHLVQGSVSASSPLLSISKYNEFFAYLDTAFGQKVSSKLKKARKLLNEALGHERGKKKLLEIFNVCLRPYLDVNKIGKKKIDYFVWSIFTFLGALIDEKNYEMEGFYKLKDQVIRKMCSTVPKRGDELDLLASSVRLILNYFVAYDKKNYDSDEYERDICLHIDYKKAVELYQKTGLDAGRSLHLQLNIGIGDRQAFYEQCIEFGQFRTYDAEYLAIEHTFYTDFCKDVFGQRFDLISDAMERTELLYGGVDIRANRLIFLNRTSDPISKLSITESKTNEVVVYNEDAAIWAKSMGQSDPYDLFYSQRNNIIKKLREWLLF